MKNEHIDLYLLWNIFPFFYQTISTDLLILILYVYRTLVASRCVVPAPEVWWKPPEKIIEFIEKPWFIDCS